MSDFDDNFGFQENFFPAVAGIVGPHLIRPAEFERDTREATDYLVLKADDMRIAARIRRPGFANFYREFTIRSYSRGYQTEWNKVVSGGFGDWMFYGHSTGEGLHINPWMIVDLDILRDLYRDHGMEIVYKPDIPNGDGTRFHAFRPGQIVRTYRVPLLIAWSAFGRLDKNTLNIRAAMSEQQPQQQELQI